MKKIQKQNFSTKTVTDFFALHHDKLIIGIFIVIIGLGFYLIYNLTYSTLINPKQIDPTEIDTQQEKINLDRYNTTTNQLEEKSKVNDSASTPQFLKNT
ncbi:MAG: hypothetical protein WC495_03315 [Patescibacteria group bacterium]|jgi:hypothetical protein